MNKDAIEHLRQGQRFLIAPHRRPDADALGSALGLASVLRALGKTADVFVTEQIPLSLQFLVEDDGLISSVASVVTYDALCLMDLAAEALVPPGLPSRDITGPVVVVDHHAAHDEFGDYVLRDSDACATGEVVVRIAEALGLNDIPKDAATPLYAAVVSDTGGFRYPTTSPETLRLGARLLEAGANAWRVAYELFEGWEPARMRLLGAVVESLEMDFDGRVAIVRVTRDMLRSCGATDEMVEGMVNYARMLRGVEVGVMLWEWPVNSPEGERLDTKVSLRSRGNVDVSTVAVALGGGGHRGAAASQMRGSIDQAADRVREELASVLP